MTSTYRLVVQGLQDGCARDDAARRLAALFKSSTDQVQPLLEPGPTVVRKGLTQAEAERYRQALADCGCRAWIEASAPAAAPGEDTFRRWKTLAEQGDPQAQYYVGQMYRDGAGTVPDALAAYRWMRIADSRGQPEARQDLQALETVIPLRDRVLARIVARDWIGKFSGKAAHAGVSASVGEAQLRSILPVKQAPGAQADDADPPVVRRLADGAAVSFTMSATIDGREGAHVIRRSMLDMLCMDADDLYTLAVENRVEQKRGRAVAAAPHAAGLELSEARARLLQPEWFDPTCWQGEDERQAFLAALRSQLAEGDAHAAIVIDPDKAVVAAYVGEPDGVALLQFDPVVARAQGWKKGTRLLAVSARAPARNVRPLIADLLTDDRERVRARRREIGDDEWRRVFVLGRQACQEQDVRPRDAEPPPREDAHAAADPVPAGSDMPAQDLDDEAEPDVDGGGLGDFFTLLTGFVFCCVTAVSLIGHVTGKPHGVGFYLASIAAGVFGIGALWHAYRLYLWRVRNA